MQYNTTLQLAGTFYNSSQTGVDMDKVNDLILEVGYNLHFRVTLNYISFSGLFKDHCGHSVLC